MKSLTNEKLFSDVKNFAIIFMPINWMICIIVTTILYFGFGSEYGLGYALGSITSFLTFGLLMRNTTNVLTSKTSPIKKAFGGNFVRVLIQAIIVASTLYSDKFNFIATLVGVMVLKVVLVIFVYVRHTFFKDKEEILDDN